MNPHEENAPMSGAFLLLSSLFSWILKRNADLQTGSIDQYPDDRRENNAVEGEECEIMLPDVAHEECDDTPGDSKGD